MSNISEWSAVEDGNTHLDQYDLEKQISPQSSLNRYTKKIMAAVKAKTDAMQAEIDSLSGDAYTVNVMDYGATGDGETDDAAAFSAAAKAVQRLAVYGRAEDSTWPFPKMAQVFIPNGVYKIASTVDTDNAEVYWVLDAAAKINGIEKLNGNIMRQFNLCMPEPSGTRDNACTMAITNGVPEVGKSAGICGYQAPSGLGTYPYSDSCGLYVGATSPAIIAEVDDVTYSSTSVTLGTALSAEQMKRLKRGMIIHTKHTEVGVAINNSRYCGTIDSWSSDGTVINVKDGWYKKPAVGTDTEPKTPPSGSGIVINAFDHVFGQNTVVHLGYNSTDTTTTGKNTKTQSAIGYELDVYNHQGESPYEVFDLSNAAIGFYAAAQEEASGTYRCQTAFSAWGPWRHGFSVQSNNKVQQGFNFRSSSQGGVAYNTQGANTHFQAVTTDGNPCFSIGAYGDLLVGVRSPGTARNASITFYSSAGTVPDSLISASGGDGEQGHGSLTINASGGIKVDGVIYPGITEVIDLGKPDNRWKEIYLAASAQGLSDARKKQRISSFSDKELDAWGDVELKSFLFSDAVELKGEENARIHSGMVAQQVAEAFERHGLDPSRYSLFCHDEWEDEYEDVVETRMQSMPNPLYGKFDDQPETVEMEKDVVVGQRLVRAAGDCYSLRYAEALCIEAAYQRRRAGRLEARIAALEEMLYGGK